MRGLFTEVGDEVDEFGRFAGVAKGDDEVVGGDDTKVTVESVLAIEFDGRRAGAIESGNEFASDIFGFSNTDDDDFLFLIESLLDGFDCGDEGLVESLRQVDEFGGFDR